jgi:hypothetical protein
MEELKKCPLDADERLVYLVEAFVQAIQLEYQQAVQSQIIFGTPSLVVLDKGNAIAVSVSNGDVTEERMISMAVIDTINIPMEDVAREFFDKMLYRSND